ARAGHPRATPRRGDTRPLRISARDVRGGKEATYAVKRLSLPVLALMLGTISCSGIIAAVAVFYSVAWLMSPCRPTSQSGPCDAPLYIALGAAMFAGLPG